MKQSHIHEYNHSATYSDYNLDAQVTQKDIAHVYDGLACIYDIWGKLTESKARKRAIEMAHINNGETVLEVAVGTGLAFSEILKRNTDGDNIGIDLSAGMLQKAKKKARKYHHGNYELEVGTALNLHIKSNSIDLLLNSYMLDLLPFSDINTALQEFKRVLKPNGRMVLVNMTKGEHVGAGIYQRASQAFPKIMGGCRSINLPETLSANGFTVINREYCQQMFFPSEITLVRITADQV